MTGNEMTQKALSASESGAIKGMINRTLIVDYGTIEEVLGDGSVVNVLLSVADKPDNMVSVICPLLTPCSKHLAINIKPEVGDKVLVLSPRRYDVDMFDVSYEANAEDKAIINESCSGYNSLTCVAILYNQFREDTFKTSINIDDKGIEITTENKMKVKVASDNKITVTDGNKSNTFTMDLTGDNPKYSDSKGMEIESTSDFTIINGKLKIKAGGSE